MLYTALHVSISQILVFIVIHSLLECSNAVIVFVHRGFTQRYPENTLAAFQDAFLHFSSIEFDIHETADLKYAVIHDTSVDRTTNSVGLITNFTLYDLESILTKSNVGFYDQSPLVSGYYNIPSLHKVLAMAEKYKADSLMMEVKAISPKRIPHLIAFVQQHWRKDILYFSKVKYVSELQRLVPEQTVHTPRCLKNFESYEKCLDGKAYGVVKINWSEYTNDYVNFVVKNGGKVLLNLAGLNITNILSPDKNNKEEYQKVVDLLEAIDQNRLRYICADEPIRPELLRRQNLQTK